MKYWSSRSRSRAPTCFWRSLAWPATASRMLRPVSSSRTCASTSAGVPWRNSWLKTRDAFSSRRDGHAGPRPRQAAAAVDRQRQRREPRQRADPLGDELVERDRVAERTAGRVRGGGQEGDVRRVAAVHVRVRHAAEDGEVVAVLLEELQVRRGRVVAAGVLGEELVRQQAEVVADAEQPPRRRAVGRPRERRPHRLQQRQRQRHARAAEEPPPGERPPRRGERGRGRRAGLAVHRRASLTCSGTARSARSRGRCSARRTGWPSPRRGSSRSPSRSENRTGAPVA